MGTQRRLREPTLDHSANAYPCPTALHTSRWTAPSASSAMRLGTATPVFGTSRRRRQKAAKLTARLVPLQAVILVCLVLWSAVEPIEADSGGFRASDL